MLPISEANSKTLLSVCGCGGWLYSDRSDLLFVVFRTEGPDEFISLYIRIKLQRFACHSYLSRSFFKRNLLLLSAMRSL